MLPTMLLTKFLCCQLNLAKPDSWQVEVEAERCRVETGLVFRRGGGGGGGCGGGGGKIKRQKTVPDAQEVAAAAALVYQVVLEHVVEV